MIVNIVVDILNERNSDVYFASVTCNAGRTKGNRYFSGAAVDCGHTSSVGLQGTKKDAKKISLEDLAV
ncbi:hypothetical protein [Companilactobacillus jidongensis]|uniref:hypothetical protein n=1 Tax=Companilactobacillus jidongensis TaxID=2486006 RepID=UPI000F76DA3B|nr:hypothetical protein [Companilactobacillus jidongensis]